MRLKFPAFTPINLKGDDSPNQVTTLLHWQITPNESQPRKDFEAKALRELADSIQHCGILQPIIVKKTTDDKYQIIAGERRWRAAKLANLLKIPVLIKDETEENSSIITLVENVQREDLNAIELAEGLQQLYETHDLSHEKIGQMIGKNRATVTNFLRLLILPEEIRNLLRNKKLELGHARSLLTLPIEQQLVLAQKIVDQDLSVRETEKLVQNIKKPTSPVTTSVPYEKEVHSWTEKLKQSLSTQVSIKISEHGKGNVSIHFESPEEIEWLIKKLG